MTVQKIVRRLGAFVERNNNGAFRILKTPSYDLDTSKSLRSFTTIAHSGGGRVRKTTIHIAYGVEVSGKSEIGQTRMFSQDKSKGGGKQGDDKPAGTVRDKRKKISLEDTYPPARPDGEKVVSGDENPPSVGERKPTPSLYPPPHQQYQRLVVKRNQTEDPRTRTSTSTTDFRQLVGTFKQTPVARSEIRDSFGQLILKPALRQPKYTAVENGKAEEGSGSDPPRPSISSSSLPLLNTSVWLDPQKYVKTSVSASTIRSGTEAARRILRGRREWLQTVRKHAERGVDQSPPIPSWPSVAYPESVVIGPRRAAYRLTGHGVPRQLLQNHVDFAGALLSENQASSLTIASRDSIRVRRPDGSHHNAPMPVENHSLQLYLAVMERITRTLSIVLHSGQDLHDYAPHLHSSSSGYDHSWVGRPSEGDRDPSPFSSPPPPGQPTLLGRPPIWHVELTRGWVVAEPSTNHLEPVVEWAWPNQVCIRLRGRPNDDSRMAVALAYDTTFPMIGKRQ